MLSLIFKRLLQIIVVLFFVSAVVFFLPRAVPGDPFSSEKAISEQAENRKKEYYGLDKPLWQQFFIWISKACKGDLGPSFKHKSYSVNDIIRTSFPVSLELGIWALILAIIIGVPLGALSAVKKNTFFDNFSMANSMIGVCLPAFVLGPIFIFIFSLNFKLFNPLGWEVLTDRILPSFTLSLFFAAYIARLSRSGFLATLSQDYIRTALAKGLPWHIIIWKHAFKASMPPVISYLGPAGAHLLTGSFIVESIFFIPGLGKHFVDSALNKDYGVLLGVTLFYAVILALFNLFVDILNILIDPRLRK